MEFFYMLTFCDETRILGSNLYYAQDEFDSIVNSLKNSYYELFDKNLEDGEYVMDYVERKLCEFYKIDSLHISAFGNL